jgi:hypothetical protein
MKKEGRQAGVETAKSYFPYQSRAERREHEREMSNRKPHDKVKYFMLVRRQVASNKAF